MAFLKRDLHPLLQSSNEVQADRASGRHRAASFWYGGQDHPSDGKTAGRDRSPESTGSDGMGKKDEQHPQRRQRDRVQRINLYSMNNRGMIITNKTENNQQKLKKLLYKVPIFIWHFIYTWQKEEKTLYYI